MSISIIMTSTDGTRPFVTVAKVSAMAKTIGSMLPMLAKRMGIDPALMASPMIASTTDMISVITYFALASLILGI